MSVSKFWDELCKAWWCTLGKAVADRRAKALLIAHLSNDQREMFLSKGYFVIDKRPKHPRFVIVERCAKDLPYKVISVNVIGQAIKAFSIRANAVEVPVYDEMLALKLLIEYNGSMPEKYCSREINPIQLV